MSLRKRPLIEGRSGSFVKMLSINEALFAVILVGSVISGKKHPRVQQIKEITCRFMTMVVN